MNGISSSGLTNAREQQAYNGGREREREKEKEKAVWSSTNMVVVTEVMLVIYC